MASIRTENYEDVCVFGEVKLAGSFAKLALGWTEGEDGVWVNNLSVSTVYRVARKMSHTHTLGYFRPDLEMSHWKLYEDAFNVFIDTEKGLTAYYRGYKASFRKWELNCGNIAACLVILRHLKIKRATKVINEL